MQFGVSELFTPAATAMAVSGGMLLGITVVFKTSLTGDVLGVSGESKGLLMQKPGALKRMTFIVGLILAGVFMSIGYGGFEAMPPHSSSSSHFLLCVRLLGGGILMGMGTSLQNGCTSGHGLTGLARLSPRSWTSVATFMGSAAITGTLARTSSVFPPEPAASTQTWQVDATITAVASAVLLFSAMCLLKCSAISQSKKHVTVELLSGLTFGAGLVTSTMAKPSKVASFLDLGSGAWDPSLMFVMASALIITFPFFLVLQHWQTQKPLLDDKFHLPQGQEVDRDLVAGAMCFGVGWGLCGMCPGPMWVLLGARPSLEVLFLVVAVLLGQGAVVAWQLHQKKSATVQCLMQQQQTNLQRTST